MGGEAETKAFVLLQGIFQLTLTQFVRDVSELFTSGFSQLLSHPFCVACTRKIENHGAKIRNNYQFSTLNYQLFCTFAPNYAIFYLVRVRWYSLSWLADTAQWGDGAE